MSSPQLEGDVTQLLRKWSEGDENAADAVTHLVYAELRKLASGRMRTERDNHTLQPTALIHEAWIRLVSQGQPNWRSRSQFFRFASHAMRQVLVDHARSRRACKRGGGAQPVTLESVQSTDGTLTVDLLALDEVLNRLACFDENRCRVVELRYFGGLTEGEIGEALDISVATVRRHLRAAEAWLFKELAPGVSKARAAEHERQ